MMKKIVMFALVCMVIMGCNTPNKDASPCPTGTLAEQLKADYHRFGVNLHSYEFFDLEDTPAPKGYAPFYISHYGRHGSRSNWDDKDYKLVIAVLDSAKTEGVLTPAGEQLLDCAQHVLEAYNGMNGRLTDRGEREHAQLATRLYNRYPEVWHVEHPRVVSIGSLIPRSIISMAAFTNTWSKLNPHIQYDFDCGEKMQEYIDPQGRQDQTFKDVCAALEDSLMQTFPYDTIGAVERLFTAYPSALAGQDLRRFQKAIYTTCVMAQDFDIDLNVLDYLAWETAYYYHIQTTMYIAIRKCNIVGAGLDNVADAQISVDEIVVSADSAIASFQECPDSPIVANLRFGHDYPLLLIVNRMGLSGVGDTLQAGEIEDRWIGQLNICMASNLQLIYYKNPQGDVLVKALYNERERRINGLTPIEGPYYRWEDVKKKWR